MAEPDILTKGIIREVPTRPVIKRGGGIYDGAPSLETILGDIIGGAIGLAIFFVLIRIFG